MLKRKPHENLKYALASTSYYLCQKKIYSDVIWTKIKECFLVTYISTVQREMWN